MNNSEFTRDYDRDLEYVYKSKNKGSSKTSNRGTSETFSPLLVKGTTKFPTV